MPDFSSSRDANASPVDPYAGLQYGSSAWFRVEAIRSSELNQNPASIRLNDNLNNFYGVLPGGYKRDKDSIGAWLHPKIADAPRFGNERDRQRMIEHGHTEAWMNTTPRQFLELVDQLLPAILDQHGAAAGLRSMKALQRVSEKILKESDHGDKLTRIKALMEPILIPLYLQLRQMGYSHQDLVV